MTTSCPSLLRGRRMRVTALDSCGRPLYGAQSAMVTTKGFVQIEVSAETEDADDVSVKNAAGENCISEAGCSQIKYYTLKATYCNVDPDLIKIVNPTWSVIRDGQGNAVGIEDSGEIDCSTGYALEVWTDVANTGNACGGGGAQGAWGYILWPWVSGGVPDDYTVENDALSFVYTGSTKAGGAWGKGPYKVVTDANGRPSPLLTPVGPKAHRRLQIVTIKPPADRCGRQEVPRPTPDPATLYVSGLDSEVGANRRSVRLRVDNHGFGPVMVTWGDDTKDPQQVADGATVTHTYPAGDAAKQYTITVADKETPVVKAQRTVTVPLPPDDPEIYVFVDTADEARMTVKVVVDNHGNGDVDVDWDDGTSSHIENAKANGDHDNAVAHTYADSNLYNLLVSDTLRPDYYARETISVPVPAGPTVSTPAVDHLKVTIDVDNGTEGGVNVYWDHDSQPDEYEAAPAKVTGLPHTYEAADTYTIRVVSQGNPLAFTEVKATTTAPAGQAATTESARSSRAGRTSTVHSTDSDAGGESGDA